ncbi:TMEM165/GDT1 family protein [bacterium]|nr:TMEM165/GDT1 family protein [bacterium]
MEVLFNSFLLVAATEMGDKTQLLAFLLVARFRKPWVILSGIFVATVLNHLLAAFIGEWVSQLVSPLTLRWVLAIIFFAFAVWVLIPDQEEDPKTKGRWGAFLTTLVAFFLAEMGDKTQLATVALAARYQSLVMVTTGTTLGMMFSDGLAVFFGEKILKKISLKYIRWFSALLFVLFGISLLFI